MRTFRCMAGAFFAVALFAQDNSINVIASKTVDLPTEEVSFSLTLTGDQGTTLEQAVQILKDTGVTEKNLVGVQLQPYGPQPNQTRIAYQFLLAAPFSKYKETMDKLQAARRLIAVDSPTMDLMILTAQLGSTEATRERARVSALPDLIADARAKADQLAKAAGLTLGPIIGLSDSTISAGFISSGYPYYAPGPTRVAFTLAVRFSVK